MKIVNHWLVRENAEERITINKTSNSRNEIDPDYLVIHYTATDEAGSAINWFKNTTSNTDGIAAHIVLDTNGHITQMVAFNCRANHAGSSTWNGTDNFNFHSVGIELVNPGFAKMLPDGSYARQTAGNQTKIYPASHTSKFFATRHKNKLSGSDANASQWFRYPPAQLKALYQLSKVLVEHYQMVQAVGHDDISPIRKTDPGPAFPWDEFKRAVFGSTDDIGKIFKVASVDLFANFRTAPSTNSVVIKKLPNDYELGLIETEGRWCKVFLANQRADVIEGKRSIKKIGWIHSSLVTAKLPSTAAPSRAWAGASPGKGKKRIATKKHRTNI